MMVPEIGDQVPQTGRRTLKKIARTLLGAMGWRIIGPFPNVPKAILIAAPHTSNWDFILTLLVLPALGIRLSWMGKHTIFRPPFGRLFRYLGGIPIDRRGSTGVVEATVAAFAERPQLLIGLAPEGTRSRVDRWKTGFYFIAASADVPIIPLSINYAERVVRVGMPLLPSGDRAADFSILADFLSQGYGKNPDQTVPLQAE